MNQINQIDQTNLFFFWLLAAEPSAHHYQCEDGQTHEPEARAAVGGIAELDKIGQSPDQERHTSHHCVAEGRAERDHQEHDARAGYDLAWPCMLDGEKEIEQHRADADQNDDGVHAAGGIQEIPRKGDSFSRHQRQ